ncbi:MAG: hypothetical protein ACI9JN_001647 [Bacteroidia bacterium]|jgi:uncharacterized protein
MIKLISRSVFFCLSVTLIVGCQTMAKESVCSDYPQPSGFVNDFEMLFSRSEVKELEGQLLAYEQKTSNEISVVTTNSYAPDSSMYGFSLQLAKCWGVGKKELNNGIVVVISKSLREVRIQNGTGIKEKFTDEEAQSVIDLDMIPMFKKDQYYLGVQNALKQIFKELE